MPALEGIAEPRIASPPVEMAPMPEIRAMPQPTPSERAAPAVPAAPVNAVNPRITIATDTPETIADALTAHLTPDDLKAVTELLMLRI